MRSIRASLLAGTAVVAVGVLGASGLALDRGIQSTLLHELDRALEDEGRLLASTMSVTGDGVETEFEELDLRDFQSRHGPGFLQLWRQDGAVIYRSPSLGSEDLLFSARGARPAHFRFLRLDDGRRVRAFAFDFRPRVDTTGGPHPEPEPPAIVSPTIHLAVARETRAIDALVARLRNILFVVGALAALLVLWFLHAIVRRGLKPLDRLALEIAGLRDDRLTGRVSTVRLPAEIEPVVRRLNEMLDRLEESFCRERTFSADIAHELRTPLAGLRTTIEVELSRPREATEYRSALSELLPIVRRMQEMAETLLHLSRLEGGQLEIRAQSVDLVERARAAWEPFRPDAAARRLEVTCATPSSASIVADPVLLDAALRNLLENAVVHSNPGGTVRIEVRLDEDRAFLCVRNSGSRVPQERAADLFERFSRGDTAREATGGHCGLGLALVRKIAVALGIGAEIETRDGGEFAITLTIDRTRSTPMA